MFRKLALNNVKKSFRDYTIYFLTLVFGVCLFYVFNSMESQKKMLALTESSQEILKMLTQSMGYVSIFISIILGFLILYANRFLIKRRKKEFGLYMLLGMDKRKISRMLIYETLCIGIVALIVGLLLGVFAAQGLAIVTAKLMEVEIAHFSFTFSSAAAIKSIAYFGIIFLIVIVFNAVAISKYKLIDLLTAGRRNEKERTPRLWISVILFLLSIGILIVAYRWLFSLFSGDDFEFTLLKAVVAGTIGTVLFFYSMSGFVLKVIRNMKGLYYKNINMFIARQISSKLSTTFVSMTLICLMLLIAITTMAAGLGFSTVMTQKNEALTPVDISYLFQVPEKNTQTAAKTLNENKIDLSEELDSMNEIALYSSEKFLYKQMLHEEDIDATMKYVSEQPVDLIRLSDYNKELAFEGRDTLQLTENECCIISTVGIMSEALQKYKDSDGQIDFAGTKLTIKEDIIDRSIANEITGNSTGILILPDSLIDSADCKRNLIYLNMKLREPIEKTDALVQKKMEKGFAHYTKADKKKKLDTSFWLSKLDIRTTQIGIKVVASFFILYVGIIFLISCAAVLALQQLSEATDNITRYQLLRKLGVEERMMKQALFRQIGIYFMVPLALAIVHSIVSIRFSTKLLEMFGESGVSTNIIMVAGFVLVIYGGYFLATYIGSKGIIKSSE